ncbi:MAG: amino acid adenylation domain-containing protein, partial [Acidobacteria bacterium]|nr:amino acid adenylation domain-containing protein [Acidobacteriota bacterium]
MQDAYQLDATDAVLQKTPYSFDVSVWELFWPLFTGATLVMAKPEGHKDPAYLVETIRQNEITTLHFVPSMLQVFLEHAEVSQCASLKRVVCSGEALPSVLVRRFAERLPHATLYNLYGPTEAAVDVTEYTCPKIDIPNAIPIGKPIANTQMYILDPYGAPAPVGVVGELYIAGVQVARGYLNRAELTAERFVKDPFSSDASARMYKTGDLARWQDDGNIEYLGRNDFQVKLRGFRIELGEIEARLAEHESILEAVVVAREDHAGDKRLVAYYTASQEVSDLRAFLSGRLPEYMVPSVFVPLEQMPLSPNGKLDRKALPAPDATAIATRAYEPPQGETETTLATIWQELLHVERIGRNDNFFEVGGHSLLATQLVSKIRTELGIELPLKTLFERSSIAQLAEVLALAPKSEVPRITPADRAQILPPSFSQERLWFINQLEPNSAAYNIPAAVLIEDELDVDQLKAAFDAVIARHENLRTVFPDRDGRTHQQILDRVDIELDVVDLTHIADDQTRLAEAHRLCRADVAKPFDLASGPLLRSKVLRLAEREHVLLLNMHHIISDGWSLGVLIREIAAILGGATLPPLPIQYADYAVWQREWLEGSGLLEQQLGYWRTRLAGAPESLNLPVDHPRPSVLNPAGARHAFTLDADLTASLKRLADEQGGTLYMVLLAAFQTLLHRYTGQDDLCVGSPIANRQYGETEALIGMFVNTLALRTRVDSDDVFADLLARVKTTCLEAYEHQDAPFEKVVDVLHLRRDLASTPLFQVMLVLQNEDLGFGSADRIRPFPLESGITKFDLTLDLMETPDGLNASLQYRTALFERTTIARMAEHFHALCRAIAATPFARVSDLEILGETEKHRLLVDFNDTRAEGRTAGLCELLAEQAAIRPHQPAVVLGDQQLTFAELHRKSSQLGSYLRAQGVQADSRVGLHTERSLEMIVGLFGILHAGGAYVPLDPDYPADRLRFMLDDAAPTIVLTQEKLAARLPETAAPAIALDAQWDAIAQHDVDAPATATHDDLAYVIYTSGSTGTPKGVMVRRGGVANLREALEQAIYTGHDEWTRVSVNASFAFDSSVKQLIQLLSGRTLVLIPQDVRLDAPALLRYLGEQQIDVLDCTPSQLVALVSEGLLEAQRIPKAFLIGGEAIDAALWRKLAERCDIAFFNVYGPAECTVDATVARITAEASIPHIGGPVANARIYIVDGAGNPAPTGVIGEICIGGAGVARGYWNRPELTAERFVPDSFSNESGARMYKTGDLGRWRADGTIQFLGRNDHQVKLRGQRIELGEIESRLTSLPRVKEAIVIAREDEPGQKRLVAYLTASETLGAEELRAQLAAQLPQYMVPSAFVVLEVLPLTPNRKVDRNALPKPEADAYARKPFEAPQGEREEQLAAIWREVLPIETIGRHDNFFELGGHSLLATQLMSKIRSRMHVDLPLKVLFEKSSVAELSEAIASAARSEIPAIEPVDRSAYARLPLSYAQERLWFLNELEPSSAGYNVPGAITIRGALDLDQLDRAINVLVERHESLRTVFPSENGQPYQQILERMDVAFARVDLRALDADAREAETLKICLAEAATPFDLRNGPLLRGTVIRTAEEEQVVLLVMHHIVSDGWSLGVLIRELGAITAAIREGREPQLAPLAIQYADYAVWQRQRLEQQGVLAKQLAYWQQKLAGVPEVLELVTDHPRPGVQTFAGAHHAFALNADLTARLRKLAEQQNGTLYMVLVAAFQTLLHRYAGQQDICVGSPIANRQYGETEGLIGMFVNTLALRSQMSGDERFSELLQQVKATCLEAYEHQDTPFEKVVDLVRPQRNLAISPLFQVMVILQNTSRAAFDANIALYPLESGISKFDLTLEMAETESGLAATLEYSTALFEPTTIARMAEHFATLCEAIAQTPEAKLLDLDLVGEVETQKLLVELNATAASYPTDECLHDAFVARATREPNRIAVLYGDQKWTYGQLLARSQKLALYLQSAGVQPDQLVGVCMDRTVDMLVAMLGILQAGGAYVPLDPAYPDDRLAYMVRDSRATIVLTQESLRTQLATLCPAETQIVALDTQWAQIEAAEGVVTKSVRPDHLAYIIYTSGSTGQPKGVAIEHHSPVTLVHWGQDVYSEDELAGVLASTSICFDLSVYEIFLTLSSGGTIVLVPNALGLIDLPNKEAVTLINTVPSAGEELARLNAIPPSVRTINLAGEPLSARLVDRLYETTNVAKVYDLYGPSEDTTYSTFTLRTQNGAQTIGRPIANTQVYILDRQKNIQPIGVPGELYIAGDGLARGYLYRPELTDEKFLPNPFEAGTRMYRTGDLARWLEDGTIQYLGRIDTQVKVRGFRIEIGEIEARLAEHPAIQDCAVIAKGEGADRQIVAFYRGKDAEIAIDELRTHLAKTLPEYMIPAAVVSLAAIPLQPNGKVDRRALARLDVTVSSSREYVAPRNESERRLVAIWGAVLGADAETIGVHDNFFELGGHSLLATQLVSRIRTEMNVELPLKTLFERSSIALLAEVVAAAPKSEVPPITLADRTQELPLSFAQERLWFMQQLEPQSAGYNVPTAVLLRGEVDVDQLERAFASLIERHESLRTIYPSRNGRAYQQVLDRLDFQLDRVNATDEEARRLCQEDAAKPFDLAYGPLLRGKVITIAADEHVLLLNMHHIITDGWSIGVLIRELSLLLAGQALPALPIQYADYSVWQREWLEASGVLDRQLAYWQTQLAGAPESLELATDSPRPHMQSFAGSTQALALDAQLVGKLQRLAEERGVTLYMVLLAAFQTLLHRYSGRADIVVGSPIANRNRGEVEPLIGFFANTLVLRT